MLLLVGSAATGGAAAVIWGPVADRVKAFDRGIGRTLRAEMVAAGMDSSRLPVYLLAWRGLAVGVLSVVWGGLGMPPVAVVLAAITYQAAPWWVRNRIAAYRRRVNEQVAGVARNLCGQVRVG